MASYVEPTPNKGSFRFGSQLHLLKDLPTTLSPGVFLAAFLGRGLGGEGEQLAQLVGRRVGGCGCLLVSTSGNRGLGHPTWWLFVGRGSSKHSEKSPQGIDLG